MSDPSGALPVVINHFTATSCVGHGLEALRQALWSGISGLRACRFMDTGLPTFTGEVAGVDEVQLPGELSAHDCRNNRLAHLALHQDGFANAVQAAAARHGHHRIGVFLGSSTSGLLQTELAYRAREADGTLPGTLQYATTHNMFSLAGFVAARFSLTGPQSVASVACASSAKVFATAARALHAGLIDAAIVGGVDTLCLTTLYGFGSLELLSPDVCRPYDADRRGISIGEAAAFALLEREAQALPGAARLAGFGESSDAHHMSSPHPQGLGAIRAMHEALQRADCAPHDIDYINLHGTATPSNDAAEDAAVVSVFGSELPVSSTKGMHGHTLGAAGALEAVVCLLALQDQRVPGGLNVNRLDPALAANYRVATEARPLSRVMSNSFGFGGANASLLFSRTGP